MSAALPARAHVITGGFPPGASAGHDHDHARLCLLQLLAAQDGAASVANDFADLARWLPLCRLLVTCVAGPYPDASQCDALRQWLAAGGHWLALHGTSGGRAERVEGMRQRRTVRAEHHALLGSYFLTHPPIRRIRVDVVDRDHGVTRGLPPSFEVEDEPYFVELQQPQTTRILLSAVYGPDAVSPSIGTLYPADTSLQPDGVTRVLGYSKTVGQGSVTYIALGHCHSPASRGRNDPADPIPPTFRGAWDNAAFLQLLRNAIAAGLA
jgi:hypothetical protein